MPVVEYDTLSFDAVEMDGVNKVTKVNAVGPDEGWPGHTLRVFRMGPGGNTPHHQHPWEHVNHVIKGRGTLTLDGQDHELKAGDFAYVPPNTDHQFRNPGDEDFEFICIVPNQGA